MLAFRKTRLFERGILPYRIVVQSRCFLQSISHVSHNFVGEKFPNAFSEAHQKRIEFEIENDLYPKYTTMILGIFSN